MTREGECGQTGRREGGSGREGGDRWREGGEVEREWGGWARGGQGDMVRADVGGRDEVLGPRSRPAVIGPGH